MYLRTPKKYRRGHRPRLFSPRSCLIWILAPILIFIMIGIYENAERWIPSINRAVEGIMADVGDRIDEVNAPPPTPTQDPSNDLRRAHDAWRRGSIQEAVNLYQRVVNATPNDILIHYRLALGLITNGQYNAALEAAQNAITANPFSPDAWAIRAMAYNRLGDAGNAIASAMRALELASPQAVDENPQLAMSRARAQAFLAEAYLGSGQGARAETLVNEALDLYPESFEALQVRGRVNWEINFGFEAALRDFREAYTIAPNMVYVGIWLARLEQAYLQNNETALQIYQEMAERNPGNPQVLFALGDYYFRVEGNYGEARSYFSRCVETDPRNADCHYRLGRSLERLEEVLNAQDSFERAIELDPDRGGGGYYYWWLAETYILLGQCPQALSYLRQGYPIARELGDQGLVEAFEDRLAQCGAPVAPQTESEAEVTPEAEAPSEDSA